MCDLCMKAGLVSTPVAVVPFFGPHTSSQIMIEMTSY